MMSLILREIISDSFMIISFLFECYVYIWDHYQILTYEQKQPDILS